MIGVDIWLFQAGELEEALNEAKTEHQRSLIINMDIVSKHAEAMAELKSETSKEIKQVWV